MIGEVDKYIITLNIQSHHISRGQRTGKPQKRGYKQKQLDEINRIYTEKGPCVNNQSGPFQTI